MRSANLLINCLHSFDILPDVRNTAGVNVAFSTFDTLGIHPSFPSRSFHILLITGLLPNVVWLFNQLVFIGVLIKLIM